MKNWYEIKNMNHDTVEISLHDEIGMFGVTAADFIRELKENQFAKTINLSVHSPGGNLLDGLAIYNALKHHPAQILGRVEGIAASAASFILMACDSVTMPMDSFLMIHNAQGGAVGEAEDLREVADIMDKLQDSIVRIYENRTGKSEAEIREMMSAETWLTAEDALSHGFVDEISNAIDVAAKSNIFHNYFKSMPINNDGCASFLDVKDSKSFEKMLRDKGGFSRKSAKSLTSKAKLIFREKEEHGQQSDLELSKALDNCLNVFVRDKRVLITNDTLRVGEQWY
ncbi:MAG: Clp protease [Kangiella sp.]|nr:MAG: Clp protease [Kangiella sp.]